LREEGGEAELDGAGLSWSGTVAEGEGEAGETVTLEGPTAAQLERGFDLGPSSVETGVYAVAQDGGEVLHVATHSFLPEDEARETTLGTVYALRNGELDGLRLLPGPAGEGLEQGHEDLREARYRELQRLVRGPGAHPRAPARRLAGLRRGRRGGRVAVERIPPSSVRPGRVGPERLGRKSLGGPSAKDPGMLPKGQGSLGRIPNVDKDGDPFTKRSPNKKPGNNSFF